MTDKFDLPTSAADFAIHMIKYVREQSTEAKAVLLNGGIEDYPHYRELVGYLRGLDEIAMALDFAASEAEKEM